MAARKIRLIRFFYLDYEHDYVLQRYKLRMVYTIVVHLHANDQPGSVEKIKAKLAEAASVYRKDKETISWFVSQDHKDPRSFTIVERYVNEDSQQYHLNNPYWLTFDPYVKPLLDREMDMHRVIELDDGEKKYEGDGKWIR